MNLNKRFFIQLIFAFNVLFFTACGSDSNPEPTGITQGDPFTDSRDSRQYKTVQVGSKRWMGENLKYESPSAGTSACYDNNNTNCTNLGRLYDFQAANVACPNGWHLPSDQEWKDLESILGIPESDLDKNSSARGTDEGAQLINDTFKAERAGRQTGGVFVGINGIVSYWTSTTDPDDSNRGFARLVENSQTITRGNPLKDSKFCVRCVEN